MAKKGDKKEGPSCACGKEDLYEVWLKNEKTKKEDDSDSTKDAQTEGKINASEKVNKKNKKKESNKK